MDKGVAPKEGRTQRVGQRGISRELVGIFLKGKIREESEKEKQAHSEFTSLMPMKLYRLSANLCEKEIRILYVYQTSF